MNTIYNTFVQIESQDQADKLKELCVEKGLNYYWNDDESFNFVEDEWDYFVFDEDECFLVSNSNFGKKEVTEEEFIELLQRAKLLL